MDIIEVWFKRNMGTLEVPKIWVKVDFFPLPDRKTLLKFPFLTLYIKIPQIDDSNIRKPNAKTRIKMLLWFL